MRPFSLLLRLLLGLAFLCGAFYNAKEGDLNSQQRKHSKHWNTVQAEVTKRQVQQVKANAHPKEKQPQQGQKTAYQLRVSYRYTVDNKELLGSLTSSEKRSSESKAEAIYPSLQVGNPLTLLVNPYAPAQTIPQHLDKPSKLARNATTAGMVAIGLFLIIPSLLRMCK